MGEAAIITSMEPPQNSQAASSSIQDDIVKSEMHGQAVGCLSETGSVIATDAQASDLFGNAWFDGVQVLVIPVARLADDFFRLSTGRAGEIMRKAINYQIRLAIVGDIEPYSAQSKSFAAFACETNKGDHVWFLPDKQALDAKLAARNKTP